MKNLISFSVLLLSFVAWSQTDKSIKIDKYFNETALPSTNRYAFLVGVDNYEDKRIYPLYSCRNDANLMHSLLVSHLLGLNIRENFHPYLDETKETVESRLVALLKEIQNPETATLYFYFSGHGEKEGLVLRNSHQGDTSTYIQYSWLLKTLKYYNIGMSVLIIDACQSGSILASARDNAKGSAQFNNQLNGYFGNSDYRNLIIFAATQPDKSTPGGESTSKWSQYTTYFYESITNENADINKNEIITSGELSEYLSKKLDAINPPEFSGPTDFPIANLRFNSEDNSLETLDSDGDGIIDRIDACPYDSGTFEFKGCEPLTWQEMARIKNFDEYVDLGNKYYDRMDYSKAWFYYNKGSYHLEVYSKAWILYDKTKEGVEKYKNEFRLKFADCKRFLTPEVSYITDHRDGKRYKICTYSNGQTWMTQNLEYYHPESIRFDWQPKEYGRYYSLKAANESCPSGWHVPTYSEWQEFIRLYDFPTEEEDKHMRSWSYSGVKSLWLREDFANFSPTWSGGARLDYTEDLAYGEEIYYWSSTLSSNEVYDKVDKTYKYFPYYFNGGRISDIAFGVNSTYGSPKMPCRCLKN